MGAADVVRLDLEAGKGIGLRLGRFGGCRDVAGIDEPIPEAEGERGGGGIGQDKAHGPEITRCTRWLLVWRVSDASTGLKGKSASGGTQRRLVGVDSQIYLALVVSVPLLLRPV